MSDAPKDVAKIFQKIVNSGSMVRTEIAGEFYSCKVLYFDQKKMMMVLDELLPKFGNDQLVAKTTYSFKHEDFSMGMVDTAEFDSVFIERTTYKDFAALMFALPSEIGKKTSHCEVKPRKNEEIPLIFTMKSNRITARVSKISVKSLEFETSESLLLLASDNLVKDVILKMPGEMVTLDAQISRISKYRFKLEYSNIGAQAFSNLNEYISQRYQDEFSIKTGENKKTPRPSIIVKPVLKVPEYKGKILLVDDEVMVTDLFSRMLSKSGYLCYSTNDGGEVIEKALIHKPDLILLDLKMPDYDGFTICRRIKKDPRTTHIPVVMLTGASSPEDVRDAQDAGAAGYILKSMDSDMNFLVAKVAAFINR